ncbi:MAG: endonuclease/exonuclease/phosphatase family protein [Qingshengfaniella sp.]
MLKVVTYNIHKAVGLDQRRDPDRILEVLKALDADVVALQEADRRLGARPSVLPLFLIAQETEYQVAPVAVNQVSLGWHGNAVLVRRRAVLDTARIPLPGLEPRGAVRIRIADDTGPINIFCAHLGLLRPWRQRQLAVLRDHIEDTGVARALLLGDFNEWSPRRGVEVLEDRMSVLQPGRSFHAARPMAALDRIVHGADLLHRDSGVDRSALARLASDHLPVWARFRIRPEISYNLR